MNDISIPIVTGPGTQPTEIDGAELDILQLPSGMDTFEAPILPEHDRHQPGEIMRPSRGLSSP